MLAEAGGRCARCGSKRKLTAHHVVGLRDGGTNVRRTGRRCHALEEPARQGSTDDPPSLEIVVRLGRKPKRGELTPEEI